MAQASKPSRKGGRPANPSGTSLSKTMNFRVIPTLYEEIAKAAHREGRSISEEVAFRLGRSFQIDEIDRKRFGDERVAFLAKLFANCLNVIQTKTGKEIWTDLETLEFSKEAVCAVLDASLFVFKEVDNVSQIQRKFDRDTVRFTWEEVIKMAEFASTEPKLSLSEIMGR